VVQLDVTLLYFEGCPNWLVMQQQLQELSSEFPEMTLTLRTVDTPEDAERLAFHGSPSIVLNGADPFADWSTPVGYSCRVYATPEGLAGVPTKEQLHTVLCGADNKRA